MVSVRQNGKNMDIGDEVRQLEQRRQAYLSTVQGPSKNRLDREVALGDLELVEAKIAKLRKPMSTEDEPQFDMGGEA